MKAASFVCAGIAIVSLFFANKGFPCEGMAGQPQAHNHAANKKAQRRVASVDGAFAQKVKNLLTVEEPGIEESGTALEMSALKGEARNEFQALQSKNGEEFPPAAHEIKVDGQSVIVVSQYTDGGMSLSAFTPDGAVLGKGSANENGEFSWN